MSVLSPHIRHRLVLESDAVAAAIAEHGPEEAEKFVQKVIWRGHLEAGWNATRRSGPAMSTGCKPIWRRWTATAACAVMQSGR